MKKTLSIVLACLLLTGCAAAPQETLSQPETTQTVETTQATQPTETQYVVSQPTMSATEPQDGEQILAYRREVVTAEMRRIMGTLWTPETDITYYLKNTETYTEDNEPITLYAGRIYQGLPYTHGSGSGYGFFSYASGQDENGVYTISGLEGVHLSGENSSYATSRARQGCDCADTLFWSWAKVSTSISFKGTTDMTEKYGCIKVGDYFCDLPQLTTSTKTVTKSNGQDVMFDAYAQLQPGDGMVLFTNSSGGHAVMVVDSHVEYTDGVIDGENSYVVIIEQTSAPQRAEEYYYNEEIGQNVYVCGAVDSVWTFNEIFKKGYLPVTCQELVDPSARPAEAVTDLNPSPTIDTLWLSTLNANYRIAYVTITISQDGKVLQQSTAFGRQREQKSFSMLAFKDEMEQDLLQGCLDLDSLPQGTYQCTVKCRLATGNTHTVHDFTFTK